MYDNFVFLVPIKLNSARVKNKNIRKLDGINLINYSLKKIIKVDPKIKVIIYCSTEKIMDYIDPKIKSIEFQKRENSLDEDNVSINDVIKSFSLLNNYENIILSHVTSPFITNKSIEICIKEYSTNNFDSALLVKKLHKFILSRKGEPLNYKFGRDLPRTQDLNHMMIEQGGLYIFSRKFFLVNNSRIGRNPYMHIVDEIEGFDIDNEMDFYFAEFLLKNHREKIDL